MYLSNNVIPIQYIPTCIIFLTVEYIKFDNQNLNGKIDWEITAVVVYTVLMCINKSIFYFIDAYKYISVNGKNAIGFMWIPTLIHC